MVHVSMQALEVNVVANAAPEDSSPEPQQTVEDAKPDLQADIPANVDEPGISLPSAQLTLSPPSESTVLEVSDEERSEQPAGQDDQKNYQGADQVDGNADGEKEQAG